MYKDLITKDPANSPLLGLLGVDQIAFLARSDSDERAIKKIFRLDKADWVEDEVVAEGYVRGARPAGATGFVATNKAKLLFNYDLGIELEILRYIDGPNYADCVPKVRGMHLCHIGAHVAKGESLPQPLVELAVQAPIIQQVETQTHTNQFLLESGRRYRYTIYDTRWLLGVYFKVIERIETK